MKLFLVGKRKVKLLQQASSLSSVDRVNCIATIRFGSIFNDDGLPVYKVEIDRAEIDDLISKLETARQFIDTGR